MTELSNYIDNIVKYYKYKSLDNATSSSVRRYYIDSIPSFLKLNGDNIKLMDKYGTTICTKYDRIVVGDYGPYIEFSEENTYPQNFRVKKGQEYRSDPKYSNCKYIWLSTKSEKQDTKIYLQKGTVPYADYIPGKYYVCVDEVFLSEDIYKKKSRKYKKELKSNNAC
jgi:hypothetical protein